MVWHFVIEGEKHSSRVGGGGVPEQALTEPTLLEMVQWREGFKQGVEAVVVLIARTQ